MLSNTFFSHTNMYGRKANPCIITIQWKYSCHSTSSLWNLPWLLHKCFLFCLTSRNSFLRLTSKHANKPKQCTGSQSQCLSLLLRHSKDVLLLTNKNHCTLWMTSCCEKEKEIFLTTDTCKKASKNQVDWFLLFPLRIASFMIQKGSLLGRDPPYTTAWFSSTQCTNSLPQSLYIHYTEIWICLRYII